MKPEEYPRETSYKYTNVVTGVLELFEWSELLENETCSRRKQCFFLFSYLFYFFLG